MARKNIFQLVEENYDIQNEIRKIDKLYKEYYYFASDDDNYSLAYLMKWRIFDNWRYRGTCIEIEEFFQRANAVVPSIRSIKMLEESIINYLEIMENFISLAIEYCETYADTPHEEDDEEYFDYYSEFETEFHALIKELEKRLGLTVRHYKDRVLIYRKNAPLEKVIEICGDEDIQWELIRYVRDDLSLSEKRKSLAYLATNLYIEEDRAENEEPIKSIIKKANNILNNLHIRHNNKTGKWDNEVLKDITESDAIALCDMVYNEMLTIVLLREHKEYEKIYSEFTRKQREVRSQKKNEDN